MLGQLGNEERIGRGVNAKQADAAAVLLPGLFIRQAQDPARVSHLGIRDDQHMAALPGGVSRVPGRRELQGLFECDPQLGAAGVPVSFQKGYGIGHGLGVAGWMFLANQCVWL